MKISLLIVSLLALTSVAWSQQGGAPEKQKIDPANILMDLRCVSLPQAQALPIVRKLRSPEAGERAQAIADVDALVAKETATLLAWLNVTTHPDMKVTAEDIEEVRYATRFEPPSKIYNFENKEAPLAGDPKTIESMAAQATVFDTRNTGFTLEAEPSLFNRRTININVVASHVWLKAMEKMVVLYENAAEKRVEKTTVEQPRFATSKVQMQLSMESGDHQLIGLFRAPDGKNQFELFILGVEVREVK